MGDTDTYDVLIVGGGINGCGIARDAAGRGYRVCLAEASDLGGATSSASSKLIHGGVRYLEHYEFRLVREALKEREVLWAMAPHIVRPMRFVMPHHNTMRPAWLLRLGLFLYDHIGGRKLLPGTNVLDLREDPAGAPLKDAFTKGFEYSDCWVEDSRLVVLNAMDAAERGAEILPRTKVSTAEWDGAVWTVTMQGADGAMTRWARTIVNAAGPWVDEVLSGAMGQNNAKNVRLVRGSHVVVRKLFDHDRAYIFQNPDGRIIFAIPYRDDYTLIGTTDAEHGATVGDVRISPEETAYLCDAASRYFREPVTSDDVVWTYSGVRPLYDDGASKAQEATRDYVIRTDDTRPLVNIFGGKITTFRRLAESVLGEVETLLGAKSPAWTRGAVLPGGDFPVEGFDDLVTSLRSDYGFLSWPLATRLCRFYGTRAWSLLGDATEAGDLGPVFGGTLTGAEVIYLMQSEWAQVPDDILFRRTRLGIDMPTGDVAALTAFMESIRNST